MTNVQNERVRVRVRDRDRARDIIIYLGEKMTIVPNTFNNLTNNYCLAIIAPMGYTQLRIAHRGYT